MDSVEIVKSDPDPEPEDAEVAGASTVWDYLDDGSEPADGWQTSEEAPSGWKRAAGPFGFKWGEIRDLAEGGDAGRSFVPATLLRQRLDSGDDVPVYRFRATFDLDDPDAYKGVVGTFWYDDAATVYINGVRVGGADDSSFDAEGYGGSDAWWPREGTVLLSGTSGLGLRERGNVVSVELHQYRRDSSDAYLELASLTLTTEDPLSKKV